MVDVEDAVLGNIEYSVRVMKLVSFLLSLAVEAFLLCSSNCNYRKETRQSVRQASPFVV